MNWKQLLASIAGAVEEDLRLRNAYLAAENRILRHQMKARRVRLTDAERQMLAEMGQKLGRQALVEIATIAKLETILAWHRKLVAQKPDDLKPRKALGRPRIDQELEALVVRIAQENRSWGYDRIVGALANLRYTISDQTVGNILKRHGIPPAPERKTTTTWREFIRIHMDVLGATDFFTHEVWRWLALVMSSMLSFIRVGHRWEDVGGWVAHHDAQWLLFLLTWSLDGHADRQRGGHVMKMAVRSRPLLFAEGVQRSTRSACMPPDGRAPRPQGVGHMVARSACRLRPIRDGPMQGRSCLGRL